MVIDPKTGGYTGGFRPVHSTGFMLDMQEVGGSNPSPPTTLQRENRAPSYIPATAFRPPAHPKSVEHPGDFCTARAVSAGLTA